MADADDQNQQIAVANVIENAILADAHTPDPLVAKPHEESGAPWPWVEAQIVERSCDPTLHCDGKLGEVAFCGGQEFEAVLLSHSRRRRL
jgi:hypothetical protein